MPQPVRHISFSHVSQRQLWTSTLEGGAGWKIIPSFTHLGHFSHKEWAQDWMPANVATAKDPLWELRHREVESSSLRIRWAQAPNPGECPVPCEVSSHASPLQGTTLTCSGQVKSGAFRLNLIYSLCARRCAGCQAGPCPLSALVPCCRTTVASSRQLRDAVRATSGRVR